MLSRVRQNWLQERAGVALYIASHRGHNQLVNRLLLSGSNVSAQTPVGRTPLHVSGSQVRKIFPAFVNRLNDAIMEMLDALCKN